MAAYRWRRQLIKSVSHFAALAGMDAAGAAGHFEIQGEREMMANRKRAIPKYFTVTEEENELIKAKMEEAGVTNFGEYARRMLINGEVRIVDFSELKTYSVAVSRISNNINQIAKRANETRSVYQDDLKDIEEAQAEIKKIQRQIWLALK